MPCPNPNCRFPKVSEMPGGEQLWILENYGYVNCCPKCGFKLVNLEISIEKSGIPDLEKPLFQTDNGTMVSTKELDNEEEKQT